jgi:hypothetical protein
MKSIEIIRLYTNHKHGTLGQLKINKVPFCSTIEPSARFNEVGESSIPAGQYECGIYSSAKYPNVYQVLNVPGRTHILFHKGNTEKDTNGCIILGSHFDKLQGIRAVMNSGKTFKKFREIIGAKPFHLTIVECY